MRLVRLKELFKERNEMGKVVVQQLRGMFYI